MKCMYYSMYVIVSDDQKLLGVISYFRKVLIDVLIVCYPIQRYKNVFGNGFLRQRGTKMNGQARVFETWRSNREKIALRDTSIVALKPPLKICPQKN